MRIFSKFLFIFLLSAFSLSQTNHALAAEYCGTQITGGRLDGLIVVEETDTVQKVALCSNKEIGYNEYTKVNGTINNTPVVSRPEVCNRECSTYEKQGQTCISCDPPPTPTPNPNQPASLGLRYTIDGNPPEKANITGVDKILRIKFEGLENTDGKVWLCTASDQDRCRFGRIPLKKVEGTTNPVTVEVCGAGKDNLKGKGEEGTKVTLVKTCKTDGSDYFHEGHVYRLGLYDDDKGEAQIMVAEFYVRHSVPQVKLSYSAGKLNVTLSGQRPGKKEKNNYQIVLQGRTNGHFKDEACVTTPNTDPPTVKQNPEKNKNDFLNANISGGVSQFFPHKSGFSQVFPGDYRLKINERINEGGQVLRSDNCQGGFTYLHIDFTIAPNGEIKIAGFEFDPNESDYVKILKMINAPLIPCSERDSVTKECKKINTAIGDIAVSPEGLIKSLFSVILSVAGVGALIIIVYGGYLFMTSRGDKEKAAAARETITSAILGLLFIIFSIVILETIGVDILKIPGLTK